MPTSDGGCNHGPGVMGRAVRSNSRMTTVSTAPYYLRNENVSLEPILLGRRCKATLDHFLHRW